MAVAQLGRQLLPAAHLPRACRGANHAAGRLPPPVVQQAPPDGVLRAVPGHLPEEPGGAALVLHCGWLHHQRMHMLGGRRPLLATAGRRVVRMPARWAQAALPSGASASACAPPAHLNCSSRPASGCRAARRAWRRWLLSWTLDATWCWCEPLPLPCRVLQLRARPARTARGVSAVPVQGPARLRSSSLHASGPSPPEPAGRSWLPTRVL